MDADDDDDEGWTAMWYIKMIISESVIHILTVTSSVSCKTRPNYRNCRARRDTSHILALILSSRLRGFELTTTCQSVPIPLYTPQILVSSLRVPRAQVARTIQVSWPMRHI